MNFVFIKLFNSACLVLETYEKQKHSEKESAWKALTAVLALFKLRHFPLTFISHSILSCK